MQGRDYYLLASRTVRTALAFASFLLPPIHSPSTPMLRVFVVVKGSMFLEMFMGPCFLAIQVSSLRSWFQMAPQHYFMYIFVFAESVLAAGQWGSAAATWGVMIDPRYSQFCGGPHEAICRRLMISCGLELLTGGLGVADTMVLLVARLKSNGPRFLDMIMAML